VTALVGSSSDDFKVNEAPKFTEPHNITLYTVVNEALKFKLSDLVEPEGDVSSIKVDLGRAAIFMDHKDGVL
jgi:hypothetical protein